jgi:hypothetical protein
LALLDDALELVSDREYTVDLEASAAAERELQVGRIVAALLNRGAESHVAALALVCEAVERVGGRVLVADHVTSDPRLVPRRRMWIPPGALRH